MVMTSSSSSSSCTSFTSLDDVSLKSIKFLCSYGGRIVPRYPDGKLRYAGGNTRVLAVHRSISFSELQVKLRDLCGSNSSVKIRCPLPDDDFDALISITSDEDLANLIKEYDLVNREQKIKLFVLTVLPSKPKPRINLNCNVPRAPAVPVPQCCVQQMYGQVKLASRYQKHGHDVHHGSRYWH